MVFASSLYKRTTSSYVRANPPCASLTVAYFARMVSYRASKPDSCTCTADGKYKCDYKFGHWTIAWNNEATLCIDDLLRVVESQPRLSRGLDGMVRKKSHLF